MKNAIQIYNLNYGYDDTMFFDHFNLNIQEGTYTSIAGKNGSGKSTLIQILCGLKKADANIHIMGYQMCTHHIRTIRKSMGVLLENRNHVFIKDTVKEELSFPLENMNMELSEINERVLQIAKELKLTKLLEVFVTELNRAERQKLLLATALIRKPKILLLDQPYLGLDEKDRRLVASLLSKYHTKEHMTIVQTVEDLEDAIYGDDIVILSDGKPVLFDSKENVLKEQKIIKAAGLQLPFMVNLSKKLQYYGLVDDLILDMDQMVGVLWK